MEEDAAQFVLLNERLKGTQELDMQYLVLIPVTRLTYPHNVCHEPIRFDQELKPSIRFPGEPLHRFSLGERIEREIQFHHVKTKTVLIVR